MSFRTKGKFLILAASMVWAQVGQAEVSEVTEGESAAAAKPAPLLPQGNRLSGGFGFAVSDDDYARQYKSGGVGPSINVGFVTQISQAPIYAGIDFGISFFSYGSVADGNITKERGAYGIQLLPTIIYRLRFPNNPSLSPYFGFSMGPHLFIKRDRWYDPATEVFQTSSVTYASFQFLARPGMDFQVAEGVALNIESKFGFLGTNFIWLPAANFVLLL